MYKRTACERMAAQAESRQGKRIHHNHDYAKLSKSYPSVGVPVPRSPVIHFESGATESTPETIMKGNLSTLKINLRSMWL